MVSPEIGGQARGHGFSQKVTEICQNVIGPPKIERPVKRSKIRGKIRGPPRKS